MKKFLKLLTVCGLGFGLTGCTGEDLDKVNTALNWLNDTLQESDTLDNSDQTETIPNNDYHIESYTLNEDLATWTYSGNPWENVDDGKADFTEDELLKAMAAYESSDLEDDETYGPLDNLGRCTVATAVVSEHTLPTEKRGSISSVKPSGWVNKKYDTSLVDGAYLYNRCHLIGFQLTGENANKQNLITGTRYLNIDGMLDFENEVAEYVKETGKPVLYRVTPVFEQDDLVAKGVRMEAYSLEDNGASVNFDIWAYNVQPGIVIDYSSGDSHLE